MKSRIIAFINNQRVRTIFRHLIMWLVVWLIYYVDLITAWSGKGNCLSVLTLVACLVSVYAPSLLIKPDQYFKQLEDNSTKKNYLILRKLIPTIFFFAILGSIASFLLSVAWQYLKNGSIVNSTLFSTTQNSLLDPVSKTIDAKNLNCIARFFYNICGQQDKNTIIILSSIRNLPEALTTTSIFLLWEAMNWLSKQGKEIKEKSQRINEMEAEKNRLAQKSRIHEFMNFQNTLTFELERFGNGLEIHENINSVNRILKIQKAINGLQRLRHSLIQGSKNLISLKDELSFVNSLSEIIHYMNNTEFDIDIPSESQFDQNVFVLSQVYTELLWNAYKYSQNQDESQVPYIEISVVVNEDEILFYIKNSIGDLPKSEHNTNSGIDSIKEGLTLHYGESNYKFDIEQNDKYFEVTIKIPVKI